MMEQIEKLKEQVSYQAILLSVTCGLAAVILVLTQLLTQPVIELRIAEDQNALLSEVLDGLEYSNDVFANARVIEYEGSSYDLFPVENSKNEVISWVIRGAQDGYSGPISFLVGVNLKNEIIGVRIISHSETPGLGDRIELAKSNWILSFARRSLENTTLWAVKKDGGDFDQFSGATITPRSVVKGVHTALLALAHAQEAEHE